jgi:uncharacterized protein YjbJ (UPF0337 family)
MSDGMRDKVERKLKETKGELTNDTMREKQGEAQQKWGEAKDKVEDLTDNNGDGTNGSPAEAKRAYSLEGCAR